MNTEIFDQLRAEVRATSGVHDVGRIIEVAQTTIVVSGLLRVASLGDQVRLVGSETARIDGEIIRIGSRGVTVLISGNAAGISIGDRVQYLGPCEISPDDSWLGRIIDPQGKPMDGRPLMRGLDPRPLQSPPPPAGQRRGLGQRLQTGLAVFNTLLPIVVGQRIGLFAGSGVGKSRLLAQLASGLDADVVVVALVGERGREIREFVERTLGPAKMARTIVVAATSDQSAICRRRAMWSAMAIAEHFRDDGKSVLLLADSVTRFAEAHREIALASGETGSMRGYPPSVAHLIMSLAERAGPGVGNKGTGDITAVFTVLVSGSDMDEPISDLLRGTLDGHVVMNRNIAERGRFPPIDVLRSVSRSLPEAANLAENAIIARTRQLLGTYERSELMVQAGLYSPGSDAGVDQAIQIWPALDEFVSQNEPGSIEDSFSRLSACFETAADEDPQG